MSDYKTSILSAINILNTSDLDTSKPVFEKLSKDFPQEFEPYYYLGIIESRKNNFQTAVFYMQKALNIIPFYQGYKSLAEFYIFLKNKKNAVKNIKMALIYNPYDEKLKEILYKLSPDTDFIDKTDICINGIYEHSQDCPCVKYIKAYDSKTIERTPPNYIKKQLTERQNQLVTSTIEQYRTNNIKEGFVTEIPNGIVFAKQSDQTHFITSDNKMLADMIDKNGPQLSVNSLPDIFCPCDNLLVLSSCWGGNFYHWLTWTVPRLQMILNAGYKLQDFDKILINYVGFKFQKELLDLLNIPRSKIIGTLEKGVVLKAKKIVTASLPEFLYTPEIVVKSLRNFFLKPEYLNNDMPKRIYLSRNKSKSRYVVNENELSEFLKSYDFTTIYAEDLTFSEQVQYFANADIILSQHGAGLTNLAFCKPETKVIEIYNEKMKASLDTAYWRISSDLNLKHYLMFGEPVGEGASANMHIDISRLKEIFEVAEIKSSEKVNLNKV